MKKIIFNNNTDIEILDVTQIEDMLKITLIGEDLNTVIEKFRDESATCIMRYYSGTDLIRGYSGFTIFESMKFIPNAVINIDYLKPVNATESGFKEETADKCIVTMKKVSMIASVANQTAQNAANIDYIAMESGIEL